MTKVRKFLIAAFVLGASLVVSFASTSSASAACVDNLYKKGSSGTCVKYIQQLNNGFAPDYANNIVADGVFGSKTDSSIRKFQTRWAIGSDGIVGNKTWRMLCVIQAGWIDDNGRVNMAVFSGWPLATAKAAGCAKYWKGMVVNGVLY